MYIYIYIYTRYKPACIRTYMRTYVRNSGYPKAFKRILM